MEPLASKIRPKNLKEFVGQEHLTGKDKPIAIAIEKNIFFPLFSGVRRELEKQLWLKFMPKH